MKLSKRTANAIGCLWLAASALLLMLQTVFLTIKLSGVIDLSWWTTLIPILCMFGLPVAIVVIAVIVLMPKVLIENRRRRKHVEAEAWKHGIARKPGESDRDLKRRIIQKNMITGNFTRKDIKDAILEAFPNVGSCQILINNQTDEIILIPRRAETEPGADALTDDELREITKFVAQYIPVTYKITVRNA